MSSESRTPRQRYIDENFARIACPDCQKRHWIRWDYLEMHVGVGKTYIHKCRNWTHHLAITFLGNRQIEIGIRRRVGHEPDLLDKGMMLLSGEEDHCDCPSPEAMGDA